MTPMIDVLLVLIIIFMVITPLTPKGWRPGAAAASAESEAEPVGSAHGGDRDRCTGSQHEDQQEADR